MFIIPKGEYTFIDEVEIYGSKISAGTADEYPLQNKQVEEYQKTLVQVVRRIDSIKKIMDQLEVEWDIKEVDLLSKEVNHRIDLDNYVNKLDSE